MPNKKELGQYFGSFRQARILTSRYTFSNNFKQIQGDPMKKENKLKEEAEFWLTYVNDWKKNHAGPVPERALSLLDNALLKLKNYYSDKNRVEPLYGANRSIH